MSLPFPPPLQPMLAKLADEIPAGDEWLYEPKWDGFRAIVWCDPPEVVIHSRDRRDLKRYFPELPAPLADALPAGSVVDCEIVIPSRHGLAFEALLLRIHPAESRVRLLADDTPASVVVFDLLGLDRDLRPEPLTTRREMLESVLSAPVTSQELRDLATGRGRQVVVGPATSDPHEAARWFTDLEALGLDGIVAKRLDSPYLPNKRGWVKVKHKRTADCVVGGYRLSKTKDGVGSLLLGLYQGDVLHYVGHTSSFKADERRELLKLMEKHAGESSFTRGRAPGGPSRWAHDLATTWLPVTPDLVCEVAYDHLQGDRFRHATTFLRWRPDKPPAECTFEQLGRPG
ncbi:MAG: ATP-dependent DNA ligase [Actinomycetota bacterium]|nr:ATP-dependent DNA ligase [Actinomycetota bacterium]